MNTRVSFEIAKLLKEKGFKEPTIAYRQKSAVIGNETILPLMVPNHEFYWLPTDWNNYSHQVPYYSMPTIAEVIMWLYDNHDIWITVSHTHLYGFMWEAQGVTNGEYFSPTDCYAAAIEYTLNNLI